MSERGSFVTQYIYCVKCAEAAERILGGDSKHLTGFRIPIWRDSPTPTDLPIIAGKIAGLYSGGEIAVFEQEIVPLLSAALCHPLRVAVLAEQGETIFHITP